MLRSAPPRTRRPATRSCRWPPSGAGATASRGERLSQTTWHRCIVWGRLGEFAETLTKGAHVQIEGDIRTREYTQRVGKGKKPAEVKRTITEVRVASILKLDRPVRTGEQPADSSASDQGVPF